MKAGSKECPGDNLKFMASWFLYQIDPSLGEWRIALPDLQPPSVPSKLLNKTAVFSLQRHCEWL